MLQDRLDDPWAAASFVGTLLQPAQVAECAGRLLDQPRPVLSIPRYRGALARCFDLSPRTARDRCRLELLLTTRDIN